MDRIFEPLYKTSASAARQREVPLQVIAVGLSRTGTESLCRALSTLGYDHVYHGFDFLRQSNQVHPWVRLLERKINSPRSEITTQDFDSIIGHCAAVTDLPCSALAPELLAAYPKAKVIINQRKDPNAWFKSYAATVDPLVSNWWYSLRCYFDSEAYWARRLVCDVQQIHHGGDFQSSGLASYHQHYNDMRRIAGDRALEWTVEDGWAPLCTFLDKPVPVEDFPKGNDPMAFEAEKVRVTVERFSRCDRNMRLVGGGLLCITVAAVALILAS